ncbi:MAG: 50S ribosomal protein L21 [Candidatus Aminicenantes bacterium]|nr:50S ribosomal protein L21 [Candidatus Aminicenantes bacterium]
MFAVIKTGGKQYVVKEGDVFHVEKLNTGAGGSVLFEEVLLIDDGEKTFVGTPLVGNAVVKADVLETFRDDKVLVFKKKRRKQFRRTRGHRQFLAKVRIAKIYPDRTVVPADELAVVKAPVVAPAPAEPKSKVKVKAEKPAPKPAVEKPAMKKPAAAKVAKTKKAAETGKPKARPKKAAK